MTSPRLPHLLRLTLAIPFVVTSITGLAAPPSEPRVIEVTARRFAFEPSEIRVAVGEPVRLVVRSADGPHGIEIKKVKVKKDIPRGGDPVIIDFTAKEPGRFEILCSEYCGEDHDKMRGALIVVAPGEEVAP